MNSDARPYEVIGLLQVLLGVLAFGIQAPCHEKVGFPMGSPMERPYVGVLDKSSRGGLRSKPASTVDSPSL